MAQLSTDAIREFVFPPSLTRTRTFLRACNVYRRFAKDFAEITRPLINLTRTNACQDCDYPTEEQFHAFETLKLKLTTRPALELSQVGKPYLIDTDSSANQLGAALLQQQNNESWRPVVYSSFSVKDSEKYYSGTEWD